MNFEENTNQLIVKDDLLILEESTIEKVILPFMRTADNMCRVLKCLNECEYLHSTKKNHYPLVVYSHHRSFRPALIALKSNQILDADVEFTTVRTSAHGRRSATRIMISGCLR